MGKVIKLDCGDNSCYFKANSGGMRTNGGCRCFENAGFNRSATASAYLMLPLYLALLDRVKELEEDLRDYIEREVGESL